MTTVDSHRFDRIGEGYALTRREGLSDRCSKFEGFFKAGCLTDKECTDLVACMTACDR